jgi:hypothetical protein
MNPFFFGVTSDDSSMITTAPPYIHNGAKDKVVIITGSCIALVQYASYSS